MKAVSKIRAIINDVALRYFISGMSVGMAINQIINLIAK